MSLKPHLPFFIPASLVVLFDQLTKFWVRSHIPLGGSLFLDWPVRLTHVSNPGALFGFLPHQGLLILLTLVLLGWLLLFHSNPKLGGVRWALGMAFGGGVGNLIDRLCFGYVTDFIDLRVWPVFNLADASITIGMGFFFFYLFRHGKRFDWGRSFL